MRPEILTASGKYFNFLEPKLKDINIEDISLGLSNTCRFGGQCKRFYSVAEHCVLMSNIVPKELAYFALMHDAAEAYIGDIPKPLKQLLPDFAKIEKTVEEAIAKKFFLPFKMPPSIKKADMQMLKIEQDQVMKNDDEWITAKDANGINLTIRFWNPTTANDAFLSRYKELLVVVD